jgi:hypothetical protein
MIASMPIAGWSWGRDGSYSWPDCVEGALALLRILARHGIAAGDAEVTIAVRESDNPDRFLIRKGFQSSVLSAVEAGPELLAQSESVMLPGAPGSSDVDIAFACVWLDGEGREHRDEKMLVVGASVSTGFLTVMLETYGDVWMPFDLCGREQSEVFAANAPRLAAVLTEMSEAFGDEVEPDDSTSFAFSTPTGVENWFDDDVTATDVWHKFEVPRRNRIFCQDSQDPGPGLRGYRRSADGPVAYCVVAGDLGVLGYVWASDAEGAASWEPQEDAEETGYEAGLVWMRRLASAKERGLRPSEALRALAAESADPVAGRVVPDSWSHAQDLTAIRELAQAR